MALSQSDQYRLIAVLALITGLLIYSMIRSKKQGKAPAGAAAPRAVPVTDAVYTVRTVRYDP